MGEPADSDKYLVDWYDRVGWRIAIGRSFQEIRNDFLAHLKKSATDENQIMYSGLIVIVEWLDEHFTIQTTPIEK